MNFDSSDKKLKDLQERNAQRLIEAKQALGEKWILHPANYVKKLNISTEPENKFKKY